MLRKYMSPMKGRIIVNAIIKMTGTLMEVVLPTILAHIINNVVPRKDRDQIILWGAVMIICSILAWIMNVVANRMASRTASTAVHDIRQDLFTRSMTLSARQIDKITISSLESRLTSDTYVIHRFLGATLRMGIRSVMLFLGGVFFCFFLSWQLALILLVLVPPLMITIRMIFKRARPLFHQVQDRVDEMVQVIRENIRGIRVSKALDKTEYEKERYTGHNKAVQDAEIEASDLMAMMSPLINTILFSGLAVVIIVGAYMVNGGLTKAGTIMAFMSYFIQITNSLMAMNRMFNIYNRSEASKERIFEVLNIELDENQLLDPASVQELPEADPAIPEVEFRNVSFSYLGKAKDLSNISFKMYPKETLGIMGATGSGKSTIARLLLRQYDVDEGEILLRGVNIKQLKQKDIKKLFGIVFQNDFLFGDTVRANIRFGRNIADEELSEATHHAQASEFLREKEGGLDFTLASKGVNLSGGQKQRLLLSRALAGDPEILILDDSSSALDFRTDAKLRQALRENFSNTSSIIIAQRVSSVRHAAQIMMLENGQIKDIGTHEDLLSRCSLYQEIASMQMGNEDDEKHFITRDPMEDPVEGEDLIYVE